MNTYGEVRAQLVQKEYEKESFKKNYSARAQENLKMVQVNKEYQSKLAQEKTEQQRTYSDILSSQLRLKEEIVSKYGTMTETERRINNKELAVYII